jgi:hypothetical protein
VVFLTGVASDFQSSESGFATAFETPKAG